MLIEMDGLNKQLGSMWKGEMEAILPWPYPHRIFSEGICGTVLRS